MGARERPSLWGLSLFAAHLADLAVARLGRCVLAAVVLYQQTRARRGRLRARDGRRPGDLRRAAAGRRLGQLRPGRRPDLERVRVRRPVHVGLRPGHHPAGRRRPAQRDDAAQGRLEARLQRRPVRHSSTAAAWGVMVLAGVHPSLAHPTTRPVRRRRRVDGAVLGRLPPGQPGHGRRPRRLRRARRWWESFSEDFWYYTFSTLAVLAVSPFIVAMLLTSPVARPAPAAAARRRLQDRRRSPASRERQSLHDALTDLPNRVLLQQRVDGRARRGPARRHRPRALPARPRPVQGGQRHARPPRG